MVGSAQYRDEEIGWILSAVVSKKNQEFIQENFENKFGRPLNHNQIRYIKNKYGKDPRFNSPLVNVRSSRTAASPSSSLLESNGRDDIISIASTAASDRQRGQIRRRITPTDASIKVKRKRSLEDDERESSVQRMAKMPRSKLSSHANPDGIRAGMAGPGMPMWNAVGPHLAASSHSLSPPPATPESIYGNSSMYDTGQQLMQGTGSFTWTPSINSAWNFGESPGLINASRHPPSTFFQNPSSSPLDLNYYIEQTPVSNPFQTPARIHQIQQHFSLPYSTNISNLPFSPSMHHLLFSPNLSVEVPYEPRQQLQPSAETHHSPSDDYNGKSSGNHINGIKGVSPVIKQEPFLGLTIDSLVEPLVPSLEELPILSADYTHSPGVAADPWMITPYEPLPFDPCPSQIPWPFGNVKDVGLTAVSSVDIRRDVRERENRCRDEIATSATTQSSAPLFPDHASRGIGSDSSSIITGLETLNMARQYIPRETPDDAAQYAAAVYAKALSSSLAIESPSKTTAAQTQQPQATDCATTIDPKLLGDRQQTASLVLGGQRESIMAPLAARSQRE